MGKTRLLYLDSICYGEVTRLAMQAYFDRGFQLIWNARGWVAEDYLRLESTVNCCGVELANIEESSGTAVASALNAGTQYIDVVVLPADSPGPDSSVINAFKLNAAAGKLKAIGCPNDSLRHLLVCDALLPTFYCPVIRTSDVHAQSVAEYTFCHFLWHAHRMGFFQIGKDEEVVWRHQDAVTSTRLLRGKTLAVLGGSGRDGSSVIALARTFGMNIRAMGSGSPISNEAMRRLGAVVTENCKSLLKEAEFVSVNCRLNSTTTDLIDSEAIAGLKNGAIIVNPAGAEVISKPALLDELALDPSRRKIGALILDMPYGGGRGVDALDVDPTNQKLLELGAIFTPRIAGYTSDSRTAADSQLADRIYYAIINVPSVTVQPIDSEYSAIPNWKELLNELKRCVRVIGQQLIINRLAGVSATYKADGSIATEDDVWVEREIAVQLRRAGFVFRLLGEEVQEVSEPQHQFDLIVDGIDGTRNFRDGNYGWCISAAVKHKDATILGVVFDPACDEMYFGDVVDGARLEARRHEVRIAIPPSLPSDFSFSIGSFRIQGSRAAKEKISSDIKDIGGRGREWGSIALSICAVARGGLGVFVQGGSKEHDHIAAVYIAQLAGAKIFRRSYNSVDEQDIIVSHPSISHMVEASFVKHTKNIVRSSLSLE